MAFTHLFGRHQRLTVLATGSACRQLTECMPEADIVQKTGEQTPGPCVHKAGQDEGRNERKFPKQSSSKTLTLMFFPCFEQPAVCFIMP